MIGDSRTLSPWWSADRWSRRGWSVGGVICALFLVIYFFAPVSAVLNVELDSSNYGTYSLFTAQERQYGAEVVPMSGPYGFVLYGWSYAGKLYWTRLLLELGVKLAFATFVLWLFRAAAGTVSRWWWVLVILLQLQGLSELVYDFTILLAGVYVLVNYARPRRLFSSGLATVVLAFLSLCKGTQLVFTLGVFGLIAVQAIATRDVRRLGLLAGTYVVALLAFWLAAGQDPLNLPGFIHGINQLSSGYNAAMGLQEPPPIFAAGIATLGLFYLALFAVVWPRRREFVTVLVGALLAGFTFLKWKHGFVRADGHVFIFFEYAAVAVLTVWLVGQISAVKEIPRAWRWTAGILTAACLAVAIYGPGNHPLARLRWQAEIALGRLPKSARAIWHPRETKQEFDAQLAVNRASFALPKTVSIVGQSPIDFFGFEHGYLPLNRLNYRPRPMGGGSFNVFTPFLQRLNEHHIVNPTTRPDYFLLNLQTIDNRLLAQDDASTLRAIVDTYTPVGAEQGMLLLKAGGFRVERPTPRTVLTRHFKFGETVGLPVVAADEMLLASFELPASLRGKLRSIFYKPAPLYISLTGDGLTQSESRRIIPDLVSLPIIFSPGLETTSDLLNLYSRDAGKTVRDFRITAAQPECYDEAGLSVTLSVVKRPKPIDAADRTRMAGAIEYPMANRVPEKIEPANSVIRYFDGLPVQMLEPPGQIVFRLTGDERGISYGYGIDLEAYTRGATDGVDFWVELIPPNGKGQQLFHETLNPLTVAADRGTHHRHFTFPPLVRPGTLLVLHTGPTISGNAGWDWGYYTGIHLESGPFTLAQFPGFNVPPVRIDADYLGAITDAAGREIFMLNAPGELTFAVTPETRHLRFRGGLMPDSYLKGETDGAEFIVELTDAGGRRRTLLKRWLQPKTVEADRGDQVFDVALPEFAPGQLLTLRTSPGPAGNNAWDWTYLLGVRLE